MVSAAESSLILCIRLKEYLAVSVAIFANLFLVCNLPCLYTFGMMQMISSLEIRDLRQSLLGSEMTMYFQVRKDEHEFDIALIYGVTD